MKINKHIMKRLIPMIDGIFIFSILSLLFILKSDVVVMAVYAVVIPYSMITRRDHLVIPFSVSIAVALTWVIIARNYYAYNHDFITLFGVSVFPFFAWSLGLFALFIIYSFIEKKLKISSFLPGFGIFAFIYWFLLITAETLAFHVFNIRDIANINHPGLPICDCIHAPVWMQTAYLTIGLVYFCIVYIITKRMEKRSKT